MRFVASLLVVLLTLFGGCSTISLDQSARTIQLLPAPPPLQPNLTKTEQAEADLRRELGPKPTNPRKWWTEYQVGRLWVKENPERSCEAFFNLSQEPRFPLANLARIRSLDVCPADTDGLLRADELSDFASEPWLTTFAIQTGLLRALRFKDTHAEMTLSFAMAQQPGVLQSEKIRLLRRALELSQGDDAMTAKIHGYLVAIAPRFTDRPEERSYLLVAADFKQAREFDKARDYYDRVLKSGAFDDLEKYRALEGVRQTYKLQKNTDVYIQKTRELSEFAFDRFNHKSTQAAWSERYNDATLLLARTLWTENQTEEARKVIAQLQQRLKGAYPADESLWVLSRIEEEAGHFEETVALLSQIDGAHITKRDLKAKILWYKAWNLRRIGKFDEAIENFKLDLKADDSAFAQSRTHYWLGRTYADKKGDDKASDKAKEEYENLLAADPLSFYGLLAARELKQELPPLRTDDPSNKDLFRDNKAFARPEDSTYFEWLIALGEENIGQGFLDAIWTATRKNNDLSPERERDLLRMYPRVGGYKSLFAHINDLQADQRNGILKEFPSLLFPQPFKDIVIEAGKKFDVEQELIHAIMRQESSFDPHARSGADAFGLLQLIPEAAQEAAKNAEVDYHDPEQLYDPAINIPLGAAFLRLLHDKYHGQFIPIVASYNASDRAIQGWLKTRARPDTLEFIEDIPFEETRGYVRLVMRNYIFYKRFNSGGKSIPFPEACLDVKQSANP